MTPYNVAVQLFASGACADDVVGRLMAAGLDAADARVVARAAVPQLVVCSELPMERASPLQPARLPPSVPAVEEPIRPGFHGWLLVVTILQSIYAAVVVFGLGLQALALSWVAMMGSLHDLAVVAGDMMLFVVPAVVLLSGMVLLFQRRRAARKFLIGWTLCCLVASLFELAFKGGNVGSLAIPLLWLAYFSTSKQLRVTLTA